MRPSNLLAGRLPPISTELDDGRILTAYYITPADGTTHVAVTHWHPDDDRPT